MFMKAVLTVLCTAGIAFYLRFSLALWTESRPRSRGYWVRLRVGSGEDAIAEAPDERKPVSRAA